MSTETFRGDKGTFLRERKAHLAYGPLHEKQKCNLAVASGTRSENHDKTACVLIQQCLKDNMY